MQIERCTIGQLERCRSTGCEWKKSFHHYCWHREQVPIKSVKVNEPNNFTMSKKKKKGRVVKEEKKYTEIKQPQTNVADKKEKDFFDKITTAKPDPWLSKIKTI